MTKYLCFFSDGLVDDVVILDHLLLHSVRQVLQTSIFLLQVDVAKTTVEQNLAGIQLKQETELCVIDHGVASEVQQRVVEICQRLLEIPQKKVGYTLLEVSHSKILI